MKKLILTLGLIVPLIAFAESNNLESKECSKLHKQMNENRYAIDKAYTENNACKMGQIMMENRKIFESNPSCFPKIKKAVEASKN